MLQPRMLLERGTGRHIIKPAGILIGLSRRPCAVFDFVRTALLEQETVVRDNYYDSDNPNVVSKLSLRPR